ncbi:MAG: hypothetical protein H0X63_11100 [Flavobacteriales bacterium]|nr:hypothetical protein [Flavobacteriales bacterium]
MIDRITDNVEEVHENIQSYIKSTIEYYKLSFYKKAIKSAASITRVFIKLGIVFFIVLFLSFGAAVLIGEELGNASHGYFIVAGFYFLIFIFAIIFGKKTIEKVLLKSTSKIFFND